MLAKVLLLFSGREKTIQKKHTSDLLRGEVYEEVPNDPIVLVNTAMKSLFYSQLFSLKA